MKLGRALWALYGHAVGGAVAVALGALLGAFLLGYGGRLLVSLAVLGWHAAGWVGRTG